MSIHCLCSVITGLLSVISNRVSVHCVSSMFLSIDHCLCSLCSGIIGCVHCGDLCPLFFLFFFLFFVLFCFFFLSLSCALFVFSVLIDHIHCGHWSYSLCAITGHVHCL